MRDMVIIVQQLLQVAQAFGNGIEYAVRRIQHRLLADVTDTSGRLAPNQPVIERPLSGQHTHHAGLAAAVATDQADTFALIELKIGVIEQGYVTKGETGFI